MSYLFILYKYQANQLKHIELIGKNKLLLQYNDVSLKVDLLKSSVVTEFYICLHCRETCLNKNHYFVFMRDSIEEKNQYRNLAAWLRQGFI